MSERPPRKPRAPKQGGINTSTSAAAKRVTPAKPKAPNRFKPVNPALDTHEERLKVAAKSAARTKAEAARTTSTMTKDRPDAVRMPDKKPDNWEVHDTTTREGLEAAVQSLNDSTRGDAAKNLDEWMDENRERDIVTTEVQPARAFRSEQFARDNVQLVSDYADYRVMGFNPERAFIRVFGTDYGDMHLFARIEALEHNIVFRQVFAKRFGETPLSRMFSVKHAIWHWNSLLNNPFVRETVRAKAIESLQVIYGITVVDEAGNTKAVKTLDDFYKDEQAQANGINGASNPQAFRHPEPGSPEAVEFEARMRGETPAESPS